MSKIEWTNFVKCFSWLPWVKLRQENDFLRRHIMSNVAYQMSIESIDFQQAKLNVRLQGGIAPVVATHFYGMLQQENAPNYLEMRFNHFDTQEMIIVHVQRCEGKTPHELRLEAEDRAKHLQKEVQRLTDEIALLKGENNDH